MKGETIRTDAALHGIYSYQPPVLTISPEAGFAASNEQYNNDFTNDFYTVDGDENTFVW